MTVEYTIDRLRKGYSPSAFHQIVECRMAGVSQAVSVNVNVHTKKVVEVAGIPEGYQYEGRRAYIEKSDRLINYAVSCY